MFVFRFIQHDLYFFLNNVKSEPLPGVSPLIYNARTPASTPLTFVRTDSGQIELQWILMICLQITPYAGQTGFIMANKTPL